MLTDLMDITSYNVKLATIIGVENAIFINTLCKLNDNIENYNIDKELIFNMTGIPVRKQLNIIKNLDELRLLNYDELEDKILNINTQKIIDLICEDSQTKIKNTQKLAGIKTPKESKPTKKQDAINALKNHIKDIIIVETDIGKQILDAYIGWVDGVYSNPKGFLSNRAIDLFMNKINEYSKGNSSIILELLDIATINGYRDADWAINVYEQKPKKRGRKPLNQTSIIMDNSEVF